MTHVLLRRGDGDERAVNEVEIFGPAPSGELIRYLTSIGANRLQGGIWADNHEPGIQYLLIPLKEIPIVGADKLHC